MRNLILFITITALFFLSGCGAFDQTTDAEVKWEADKAAYKAWEALPKAEKLKRINADIEYEKKRIVQNQIEMDKIVRGVRWNHPYEGIDAGITGLTDDNLRRKRKIKDLTEQKAAILQQEESACFPGETYIQSDRGQLIPISRIKAGDMVMTFDIGTQTNVARKVVETYKNTNNHYYLINNAIKTTAYERFLTTKGWDQVLHLKIGDKIQTSQGMKIINSLTIQNGELEVYNLQIEKSHTFYVIGSGEDLYLVHNSSGGSK